jgi:ribosome-associated protein
MDDLRISARLVIPVGELRESFVRSSGPGGQNVNKVATAVQLRFDVRNSPSLSEYVRGRLLKLAAGRISSEGVLIIEAQEHRQRERNRVAARERLATLLIEAAKRPRKRVPTKPTKASKAARRQEKSQRARIKQKRGRVKDLE